MAMGELELKDIVDRHGKWLRSEPGGERADLSSADLSSADLSYANLSSADLSSADLSYANLSSADLSYANLSYANLSSADLSSADLSSANLSSADLRYVKKDFYEVISNAKLEVPGLYDALMRGKINGTQYSGECACLVGTIANVRKVDIDTLDPNSSRPAERWFLGIREGDIPQSSSVAKITQEWIEEFAAENNIPLPRYRLVSSDEIPEAFK